MKNYQILLLFFVPVFIVILTTVTGGWRDDILEQPFGLLFITSMCLPFIILSTWLFVIEPLFNYLEGLVKRK